jgi:acetyltransferase-like isoleucine patch superfamily enzyme
MYREPWLSIDDGAHVGKVKVKRGRTTFISWGAYVAGDIEIGEGCLIGPNVTICSSTHGTKLGTMIKDQPAIHKKVVIGDGVWIGAGAIILGGNIIMNGAVIGAGSVLTEDNYVGENEIWVGNSAKLLRKRL